MRIRTSTKKVISLMLTASIMLSGCSGGGGASSVASAPTSNTLSGTAAVGTPISHGTVNIVCATGAAIPSVTTNADGVWTATLSNQTMPCAVEVSGGTINAAPNPRQYHSIATTAGTVNITPLTDLIVANLTGSVTPSAWFANLAASPSSLANITSDQVSSSFTKEVAALSGLAKLGENNPISSPLVAAAGNTNDDLLTALAIAISNAGVTFDALLADAASPSFTAPLAAFNAALTSAYSSLANRTSNTVSATCPVAQQSDVWANVRLGCLHVGQTLINLSAGATGATADTAYILAENAYDSSTNKINGKTRYFKYFLCIKNAPANLTLISLGTDMTVAIGLGNFGTAIPNGISTASFGVYGGNQAGLVTQTCDSAKHPLIVDYATKQIVSINLGALANLTVYDL